jgi:ABC-type phosphate transport system substrate-binding protein
MRAAPTRRFEGIVRKIILVACAVAATGIGARGAEAVGAFKVIVNPKVEGRAITRDVLAQIYLGKADRWGDGRPIAAVDLSSTSSVREAFSAAILGMPVVRVKQHWMQFIAAGKRPPLTKQSDEEVIAFVAATPGGIGYVSEAAAVPAGVKPVDLR